jgi:hypothetical protein
MASARVTSVMHALEETPIVRRSSSAERMARAEARKRESGGLPG